MDRVQYTKHPEFTGTITEVDPWAGVVTVEWDNGRTTDICQDWLTHLTR